MRLKRSRGKSEAARKSEERTPAAVDGRPAEGRAEEKPAGSARGGRARRAGAATIGAVGTGVLALARLVMTLAVLIALLIGAAILLRDLDANASNSIVKGVHDGANFFAGAFTGFVKSAGHPKREITIDWGIALVAYLIVGGLLARAIGRIGMSGVRFHHAHGRPV